MDQNLNKAEKTSEKEKKVTEQKKSISKVDSISVKKLKSKSDSDSSNSIDGGKLANSAASKTVMNQGLNQKSNLDEVKMTTQDDKEGGDQQIIQVN